MVLIVEDDEPSFFYLKVLLTKLGISFEWVQNGEDAVRICKERDDFKMILMDMNMPLLNGFEATAEIRKFNKDIPIIAQTAFAIFGDREEAIESGCNDYISKPIDKNKLIALIEKYLVIEPE